MKHTIAIAGKSVKLFKGHYTSAQCTPQQDLSEGAVTLVAYIEDQAGNPAAAQSNVVVDTVPIQISISTPINGLITGAADIHVRGNVGPGVTKVTVNGVQATLSNSFTATVPLRAGRNMIVAVAENANGKTGTASVDVTRDNVAPIVRIDSPRDGFVSLLPTIAISGQVNDIVNGATNARVFVNGVEATVGGGAFMFTDLSLVNGPNTVEAVATDMVGNEGRHRITVTFQRPVGARIGVVSGNGQAAFVNQQLSQPLVASVKDDLGNPVAGRLVTFQVTRNNGLLRVNAGNTPKRMVQVNTDGNGLAAVTLTLGDTAGEGNNRVTVTGQGVAGEGEFCASGLTMPADKILMSMGDNQRGVVGHPLPTPFEALVVDTEGNPVKDVPVTFTVSRGTGNLDGQANIVKTTGADGLARAVLTLGPEPGINNNVVTASFQGLTGLPASFVVSGLLPGKPDETRFRGVVLDNAQTPIPGAVVSIGGTTVSGITDAQGQFELNQVPVGHIHLRIDPTNSPRPETFPPLEFEVVTVAGQINTVGQPILIPPLDTENSQIVGGNQDVILTMKGVEGLALKIFANSVTCPDGSRQCRVTISQVHLDKVPMPPPGGIIFMPPAWTIQPAGTHFNPPAQITIPNNGLPPGRVIDIFQFDHDLFQFINVGKGSVSEDGSVIVSDPGFGITTAGWGGGGTPPPPPTCVPSCPTTRMGLCTISSFRVNVTSRNPCRFTCVREVENKPEGTTCSSDFDECTNDICKGGSCEHESNLPGQSQKDFCTSGVLNFACCVTAGETQLVSRAFVAIQFPGFRCHNDLCDAARHAHWNCLISKTLSGSCAQGVGDAHEFSGQKDGQPCNEAKMDLFNNQVGRNLAGSDGPTGLAQATLQCNDLVLNNLDQLQPGLTPPP